MNRILMASKYCIELAQKEDLTIWKKISKEFVLEVAQVSQEPYMEDPGYWGLRLSEWSTHLFESDDFLLYLLKDIKALKTIGFIVGQIKKPFFPFSKVEKIASIEAAYVAPLFREVGHLKRLENKLMEDFVRLDVEWVELNFLTENVLASQAWHHLGYKTYRETCRKNLGIKNDF